MRYCKECKYITDEELRTCPHCKGLMTQKMPSEETPVAVIRAYGIEKERIITALKDNKIPCTSKTVKKQLSSEIISGVNSASEDIFVPYGCYEKARDLLIGIGAVKMKDEVIVEDNTTDDKDKGAIADNGKRIGSDFEEMDPKKRLLIRIISVILFIILVWGVVALTDYSIEMIKSFFNL